MPHPHESEKSISVAILTNHARLKLLIQCLESLLTGTKVPDQIVVLNNLAHSEETHAPEFLEALQPILKKISFTISKCRQLGFAEARNRAVSLCTSEFVAILDDDCEADEQWLEQMHSKLQSFDAVGGVVFPPEFIKTPLDWDPELNWVAGLSPPSQFEDEYGVASHPSTSNMAFRRNVFAEIKFQEIGGELDKPDVGSNYLIGREDAQFWKSVRQAGFKTCNHTEAIVYHHISRDRFRVGASLSRAKADGYADWYRNKDIETLKTAASDVVQTPVKIFEDVYHKRRTYKNSQRLHKTWKARQWSHLQAAVLDQNSSFEPFDRNKLLAKETFKLSKGLIHKGIRKGFSKGVTTVKSRASVIEPFQKLESFDEHHIVVVTYPNLGDSILWIPLIDELLKKRKNWSVSIVSAAGACSIFKHYFGKKVQVVELPRNLKLWNYAVQKRLFQYFFDQPSSAILMSYFHHGNPLAFYFSNVAPVYTWKDNLGIPRELWNDLSHQINADFEDHEQRNMQSLLAVTGFTPKLKTDFEISTNSKADQRIEKVLDKFNLSNKSFLVMPLDGRENEFKFWPLENLIPFCVQWIEKTGVPIVFDGTKSGRSLYERILLEVDEEISLKLHSTHGYFNPLELLSLLKKASLVVGIDCGPMHLARAVNTPTLTLFGATNEKRWGPSQAQIQTGLHQTIRGERAPFEWTLHEAREISENEHMRRLTADEVLDAALKLWKKLS